ncbi:unnamed protein product [Jaminaea pallidilutea]
MSSRPTSPLPPAAFRHGTGSLMPLDWSLIAVRIMILAIASFPLLCWGYVIVSLGIPRPWLARVLPTWLLHSSGLKMLHRLICLPWASIEAAFSLWYAYQKRRIQRPGPRPLYSRRFLHRVFARALKSGMAVADDDGAESQEVDRHLAVHQQNGDSAVRRRKTSAREVTSRSVDEGEDPEPWFQAHYLDRDDPRAVKFQREQAKWFHLPPTANSATQITRRDGSRWLSWSLFSCDLEELEAEHRELTSSKGSASAVNGIAQGLSTRYHTIDDVDSADDKEDPDLKKVLASPRDWTDIRQGTRLEFVRKARRLIESRQGFAYPLIPGGHPAHEGEIDGEGSMDGSVTTHSMRLTIDPVHVSYRPFLKYCVTQSLSRLTIYSATHSGGFKLCQEGRLSYLVKVPPGWTAAKAADPANKGLYRPTIFLHGLGIGLAQYHHLVHHLASSELAKTHPLMIPLQPHTSQALFSPHFLKPLTHHEMIRCLRKVFRSLQWEGIQILSHSMGTIVHSWLLKSLGSRVERSCFVDPVCVRLWIPDVAGNFVYRKPWDGVSLLMRYFVGTELGTANTLCRYFDWASAILWPEDEIPNIMDRHRTTFFLAGKDAILSCEETRIYLLEHGLKEVEMDEAAREKRRGGLIVDWEAAHGELLMRDGDGIKAVMNWLSELDN